MSVDLDAPAAGLVERLREDAHYLDNYLDFVGSSDRIVRNLLAASAALQAPQEAGLVRDLQLLLESYTAYAGDAVPASIIERSRELHARLSALSQPVATPAPHGDYWHSINTAPEDEHVILATSGDHVGEALMLRDQDSGEQKWTWAGGPVSKFHMPLGWRPMPSPIRFEVPDDNRSGGFDGPTGAE